MFSRDFSYLSNYFSVTTFTKPFIVGVVTNENEATNTKANRGFNLLYSQQPCLTSG